MRAADIRAVSRAIARGFHDNEVWEWVLPSPARRDRVLPRYYESLLKRTFMRRGAAFATTDQRAGALWFGPADDPFLRPREQLGGLLAIAPAGLGALRRGARGDRVMHENHPREPHYYLLVLSVDPEYQRRGYGAALMRPMLDRADAEEMPSFLETNRESNVPYYRRFGFELTERVEIPGGPPLWLMWREPDQAAGRSESGSPAPAGA